MSIFPAQSLALLLGLALVPGGEKFSEGVRHFRAGRYEKSYALLREADAIHREDGCALEGRGKEATRGV